MFEVTPLPLLSRTVRRSRRWPCLVWSVFPLALSTLLLTGCGGADPFVGNWQPTAKDATGRIVIAKVGSDYRVTFVFPDGGRGWFTNGSWPLTRNGHILSGHWTIVSAPGGPAVGRQRATFTYQPASGHLLASFDPGGRPFEFVRLSRSTAPPTPIRTQGPSTPESVPSP
jgi:hypothetical protein